MQFITKTLMKNRRERGERERREREGGRWLMGSSWGVMAGSNCMLGILTLGWLLKMVQKAPLCFAFLFPACFSV